MDTINKEVISELGYQLSPNLKSMNKNNALIYQKIIEDLTEKEVIITKIEAKTKEMEIISRIIKNKIGAEEQHKLLERFYEIGKYIDGIVSKKVG